MIPETKICGWCKIEKPKEAFQIRKKGGGKYQWLRLECKECQNNLRKQKYNNADEKYKKAVIERNKLYTKLNKERVYLKQKEWKDKNAEYSKEFRKKLYLLKSDEIKAKRKRYYYANREKCIKSSAEYDKNNLPNVRARQRKRHNKRKKVDVHYTMMRRLRGRIFMALKNKSKKAATTSELIGCSISFLIQYLEERFTDVMSWENQGKWHIDHKIPCAKFDLSKASEQRKCFHYTNLQPLWGIDNIKKGSKILKQFEYLAK